MITTNYFITNILQRYAAFFDEYCTKICVNSYNTISRRFIWRYDTVLMNKPIFCSSNGDLYDYSEYKNLKATKDNYKELLKLNADVKVWKLESLSKDAVEKIMTNNIETELNLERIVHKAMKFIEIENEMKL